MATVTRPAASRRLTTLARARAYLGVPGAVPDRDIDRMVDAVSAAIAAHCGQEFGLRELRQTVRGIHDSILLDALPVVRLLSVSAGGRTDSLDAFDLNAEAGILRRHDGCWWGSGDGITITYEAGYHLPGSGNPTLPADVEDAALIALAARWHGQGRDPMLRSSSTEGVGSTSWIASGTTGGLPPQVVDMLAPYKRGPEA